MNKINFTAVILIAISSPAFASSFDTASTFTIGFGTKYAPKYIGSDKYDIAAAPYLGWSNGSLYINSEKGFALGIPTSLIMGPMLGRLSDTH